MNELHPDAPPPKNARGWRMPKAIPRGLLEFGKYPNLAEVLAGDLILVREVDPDPTSKRIAAIQQQLGYPECHAQWTHVAMALGDHSRLIEVTIDGWLPRGRVQVCNVWKYCDGAHAIRIRRPLAASLAPHVGWLMVIEAMHYLNHSYDVMGIWKFVKWVKRLGRTFWLDAGPLPYRMPLACSSMYALAHGQVTRTWLGETGNGAVLPAFLSLSGDFEDVTSLFWRQIVAGSESPPWL